MIYNFCINDFEGPLDVLLHLVKESKMDIYEINISSIIDQYLDFIHSLEDQNIDIASEYLVMASELVHLKSRLLINRVDDEDEPSDDELSINSEEDLRNKIIEYEKYKMITKEFKELEEKRGEVFTKLPENIKEYMDEKIQGELDISELFNAYKQFIERQELLKPLNTKITKKEINIEDKIKDIRTILNKRKRVNFLELFTEMTKENIVVTFLSILEMSKNNEILLTQENNFSPIMIERK
jgi:segregation and condensation protein A